ncbi:hypothetical protein OG689_44405 [Kitasatospora sp. NBC_00240]|uniref:hypothetical protein n=1 Tax=Kitasatospora sp. NBC_00240 TaxID=2903567 RepID=UPI0022571021|nr:hypothetical protein [Kitasatospora sp. NBC_00240]MCX5216181.1 hypothetical protein [Kitasatospora sp. NBC_00240]
MGILFAGDGYKRLRSLWIDGTDMLQLIGNVTAARYRAGRLRGQWDDPIEAELGGRGSGTPDPTLFADGEPDSPAAVPFVDLDDGDDQEPAEYGPDKVPVLLARAHAAVAAAGGRMHTGPLSEALGHPDVRRLGKDLNGYLRDVGVERPGGGQLRVRGVERPGLGYYAETLQDAIDKYRQ